MIPGATRDITAPGARPNTRRFQRSAKENLARVARFPDRVMRRKSSTAHAVRLFCCIRSSTLEIRGSVAGGIAQLVERQLCKLDVRGSNPLASIFAPRQRLGPTSQRRRTIVANALRRVSMKLLAPAMRALKNLGSRFNRAKAERPAPDLRRTRGHISSRNNMPPCRDQGRRRRHAPACDQSNGR